nr:Zn-dependent exopeptidase M28 [Clostridia bacterium]
YMIRRPEGEVKRRIIMGGHADSSWEWRYTHMGGKNLMIPSLAIPIVGLFVIMTVIILALCHVNDKVVTVLGYAMLVLVPFDIGLFFFINHKVVVQGANDNLTGCMAACSVMKFMGDNGIRFENTEVVAMLSGAEESGLRGMKAFVKEHKDWLLDPNVETMVLEIDTLRDYEDMFIYNRDMSGLCHHDERVCDLVIEAGKTADAVLKRASVWCGASDCVAMSQAGVPAATLAAMNPGPPRYYHTREDTWDNMQLRTIEKGIDICLEVAFAFDEHGLGTK